MSVPSSTGAISIGAISIGQAPRPDLVDALRLRLPPDRPTIVEIGALDGLDSADLRLTEPGGYPLTTRMRDGTKVTVDEAYLAPLVQAAVDSAERQGCVASILLCAGGFDDVHTTRPLVRPFALAVGALRASGVTRIGVIVPIDDQLDPSRRKWSRAGFEPIVQAARLGEAPARVAAEGFAGTETIVLDFVGHPAAAVARFRDLVGRPVLDVGELAAATLAAIVPSGMRRQGERQS